MDKVIDNLYIGDRRSEKYSNKFDRCVNCTENLPMFGKGIRLPIRDPGMDKCIRNVHILKFATNLSTVLTCIHEWRKSGKKVLVYCNMGMQRSVAVVLAYLTFIKKMKKETAISILLRKHPQSFFYGMCNNFAPLFNKERMQILRRRIKDI